MYEDNLDGKISDERFAKLTESYEAEQKALEARTAELETLLSAEKDTAVNVDSFLSIIRKYTDIRELTPDIIHEFVDKIYIYKAKKIDGDRVQRVRIVWNFIGDFTAPTQENREMA